MKFSKNDRVEVNSPENWMHGEKGTVTQVSTYDDGVVMVNFDNIDVNDGYDMFVLTEYLKHI